MARHAQVDPGCLRPALDRPARRPGTVSLPDPSASGFEVGDPGMMVRYAKVQEAGRGAVKTYFGGKQALPAPAEPA